MNIIFFFCFFKYNISNVLEVYLHLFCSLLLRKRFHCMVHGDTICNWHVDTLHGGDTICNCRWLLSHYHRSSLSSLFFIIARHSSILLPHPIVFALYIYITHVSTSTSLSIQFSSLKNHTFQMVKNPVTVLVTGAAGIHIIPYYMTLFSIYILFCFGSLENVGNEI